MNLYRKIIQNRLVIGFLMATNSAILAYFIANYVLLVKIAENHISDIHTSSLALPRPQSTNIAVILITEETLAPLPYRSPLDRKLIADILLELESRSVAAIGLNVVFDRPTEPSKDSRLYRVLRDIDVPVIVSTIPNNVDFLTRESEFSRHYIQGVRSGLSHIYLDSLDYTVREILLRRIRGRNIQLGFAAAIADTLSIEIPQQERLRIDFREGPNADTPPFPIYAAHKLAEVPPLALKDRIVLIGSDLGLNSRHRTPLSIQQEAEELYLPGILIEAHALSQLIEGRTLKLASSGEKIVLIVIAALTGILIALSSMRWIFKILVSISIVPLLWTAIVVIFVSYNLLLPLVTSILAYAIATILGFSWEWKNEFNKRYKVQRAFGHFLAPAVIDQILNDPQKLELGGEIREVSLLFTDLEGFTALTEENTPQRMVRLVNSYLEESCEIVIRHGGTIDKIVGDALHVMFNAPVFQNDHAQRAVNCALELNDWSNQFRQRQIEFGINLGVTRIGVNTGECMVGNFGGRKRFDYTAHGNAINTAARLESINQRLGTTICVSETTVKQCTDPIFLPIATLVLYGKSEEIEAYCPCPRNDEYLDTFFIDRYKYAYSCLNENKIEATELFRDLFGKYPNHPLVRLHHNRLSKGELGTHMVMRKK